MNINQSTMSSWVKKKVLGKGTFGTVSYSVPRFPRDPLNVPAIAVKSADYNNKSSSLQKEAQILHKLRHCPGILRCFGEDVSFEDGIKIYNMLLEFAPGGSLKHLIRKSRGALPERDVREYTRMILEALSYVHGRGYVHCDIKPGNILVFPSPDGGNYLKIADFGAAKKRFSKLKKGCPGTLFYRPPESVSYNLNEAPMDIWALGCTVIEMITGKHAWAGKKFKGVQLRREIALGEGLPGIPQNLSDEGKDFLRRCLVRDWRFRWTAEMLLHHPFVAQEDARFHSITASRAVGFASNKCSSSYDKWISEEPAVKEDYKLATNYVSSQVKEPDQPAAVEEYHPLAYDNQLGCPCYKCTNYVLSEPKASDQPAAVEEYHPLAYDNQLGCPCYKCKFFY